MMTRILFAVLMLTGAFVARGSDAISAPVLGASATVTQPHVTAELIPETTSAQAGQPFDVALHLHADAGWHTYWINPGDAGLATSIAWTLPAGFTAGPIQWPTPEKHDMGGLMTYGYAGDVYLLTTITPPKTDLPQHFEIKAKAQWLVCQEECIPGKADLTVPMDSGMLNLRLPQENKELFAEAKGRLPVESDKTVLGSGNGNFMEFAVMTDSPVSADALKNIQFFPVQPNVFSATDAPQAKLAPDGKSFTVDIKLGQNGDKLTDSGFVLVSDQPLIGNAKAVYFPQRASNAQVAAASGAPVPSGGSASPSGGPDNSLSGSARSSGTTGGSPQTTASTGKGSGTYGSAVTGITSDMAKKEDTGPATATLGTTAPQPILLGVLGAAFIGGLILNLMPCVLPVLSLKVFSLMKHAGENKGAAWIQGLAFTAGVVISFWVLAGLLLILRSAGNQLGWGFQMQSPGFVLGLVMLFFLLGLNLFGVFELGASLVGLDAKTTGKLDGTASSFGNGALATLAATPCTAPFMGSALGFAAQQPAYISLLIFTFLALGMATPYLLLTIFPGALRFVPKPGAWMESFKQFMGFLLLGTVIYLVYVFGALVGEDQVPWLLAVLLLASIAAWIYGKWATPMSSGTVRGVALLLAFGISGFAIYWGVGLAKTEPMGDTVARSATATNAGEWQPWNQSAVDAALAKGQPVFVDFTAAWCLSCKVNEKLALGTDAVKKAFTDKNVALFRADWTHSDPVISETLQKFNRDGVPLYLVYSPKEPAAPQVLPEVLTPGIVLDAVGKL